MSLRITGLDELQKELEQAGRAFDSLQGEIATLQFDPADPSSVERVIAEMEHAIDGKLSPYLGNSFVENLAVQLKTNYRNQILERAASTHPQEEILMSQSKEIDSAILRQIDNTVSDLRRAEFNTFERHIKKLSRLLHSPDLGEITRELVEGIDLDAWLQAGYATQGGMIGSARLEWPSKMEKELGTVVLLIDRFSENPRDAVGFCRTFYYSSMNNISGDLRNMADQMIVTFSRDYIDYVKHRIGMDEAGFQPAKNGPVARKAFVVHGHDEGAREMVARFLEGIGFEAIILNERANQGRTVIEKIEAHGDVGFAVVLLSPDDVGSAKNADLQPRARQNVLLAGC